MCCRDETKWCLLHLERWRKTSSEDPLYPAQIIMPAMTIRKGFPHSVTAKSTWSYLVLSRGCTSVWRRPSVILIARWLNYSQIANKHRELMQLVLWPFFFTRFLITSALRLWERFLGTPLWEKILPHRGSFIGTGGFQVWRRLCCLSMKDKELRHQMGIICLESGDRQKVTFSLRDQCHPNWECASVLWPVPYCSFTHNEGQQWETYRVVSKGSSSTLNHSLWDV